MITGLSLRDVRCFAGEARGEVRRITVLVGENSTGKSTFLGCYRVLARLSSLYRLDDENHFDVLPFSLGDFDSIARAGASEFGISAALRDRSFDRMDLTFGGGAAPYPVERSLELHVGSESLRVAKSLEERWNLTHGEWTLPMKDSAFTYRQFTSWLSRTVAAGFLPYFGELSEFARNMPGATEDDRVRFGSLVNFMRRAITVTDLPEVVTVSASERKRRYSTHPLARASEDLLAGMGEFGTKVGLFSGVETRERDGWQEVFVEMPDGWRNLMDVGRGVHAALPLLQEMQRVERQRVFLLEEPERCLHPTAQAELAQLMAEGPHHFLIETHSDYFLDRFRICVMREQMDPADLRILYFEPDEEGEGSVIHDISVDDMGNLNGAPPRYREFFHRELDHLMGLGAD